MSASARIVSLAAATLPSPLRDRYREQWSADLRDAAEIGLHPSQIAWGSAAFALTVRRPMAGRPALDAPQLSRRAGLVRRVGLVAALVGLSQYASMAAGYGIDPGSSLTQPALAMSDLVIGVASLGSVLALLIAFGSRRMPGRVRGAAVLFAAASASPIVQSSLNAHVGTFWTPALQASAIVYGVGAALTAIAVAITREPKRAELLPRRAIVVAAASVLVVGLATLANAILLWSRRPPLAFGNGPRTLANPIYVDWLRLKEGFEALMSSIFVGCGIGLVVLVAVFVVGVIVGRPSTGGLVRLTIGASLIVLLVGGSLVGFLELAQVGIVPAGEVTVLLTVARLALVGLAVWSAAAVVSTARRRTTRLRSWPLANDETPGS